MGDADLGTTGLPIGSSAGSKPLIITLECMAAVICMIYAYLIVKTPRAAENTAKRLDYRRRFSLAVGCVVLLAVRLVIHYY